MKINFLLISAFVLLLSAGGFLLFKTGLFHSKIYNWDGVRVENRAPGSDGIISSWADAQVSMDEITKRSPDLKTLRNAEDNLQQIVLDSEHYFRVLSTAEEILIEKLIASRKSPPAIPPYEDFERDFSSWLKEQNISVVAGKNLNKKNIFFDFEDQYRKRYLREFFAKEISGPLQLYVKPPNKFIDWAKDGIASFGSPQSKVKVLFLCDMSSPPCFKALEMLKTTQTTHEFLVSYRPAVVATDIYANLRMQLGACIAQKDGNQFWEYFSKLKNAPLQTEEPDLYALASQDEVSLRNCMVDPQTQAEWRSHEAFFNQLWQKSLPVLIVNGEPVLGPFSSKRLLELLGRHSR